MKYLFWIGVAILLYILIVPTLKSQGIEGEVETRAIMRSLICAKDFDFAHRDLTESYGEEVIWEGITTGNKILVRLYMNKEKGLWTVFEIYPDGSGCAAFGGNQSTLRETTSGTEQ